MKTDSPLQEYDFVVIGGGIVGVATALQIIRTFSDARVLVVEKEDRLASHQTGHNSGVIHSGVYYMPGSLKSRLCKEGAAETYRFCRQYNIPVAQCGKLLVATGELECERLSALEERCIQNEIEFHRLSRYELQQKEPNVVGDGALFIPGTGITDYVKITRKMAELFVSHGGQIELGYAVSQIKESQPGVDFVIGNSRRRTRYLVACGGLMSDRIARTMHTNINYRIVPFRGEYYEIQSPRHHRINHLIYPVPDPELPFLGVHLTKTIDHRVTVGPNAVLGWKREGYQRINLNLKDAWDILTFSGFWSFYRKYRDVGFREFGDSLFKRRYLQRVKKFCPALCVSDLVTYPAGIRAQALNGDGTMVHDFLFCETEHSLHVCNAPSPAATSAIPIASHIVNQVKEKFKL